MTTVEALQRSSLFGELTETGLRIFAAIATERTVAAGAPLFAEDAPGESMFVVKRGVVRLTRRTADGEQELGRVGPGEHLGALALLAQTTRLVTAVAVEPCEVLELAQRDFVRLQPQKPQACLKLALAIARDLAARAGATRDALRDLGGVRAAS